MDRVTIIAIVCIFVLSIIPSAQDEAYAQEITYSPASLTINQSMRSAAMGGATVAMEGYPGAALINPATIGVDQTIQAQTYLFNQRGAPFKWPYFYINDQPFSFFSPTFDFRYNKGAVSVSIPYYDLNAEKNNYQNSHSLNGNFYEYAFQLAGAWELNRNVRIGIGLKHIGYRFRTFDQVAVSYIIKTGKANAIDIGTFYHKNYDTEALHTKISLGGSLLNFGTNLKYDNGTKDPLPLNLNAGFGIRTESAYQWNSRPFFSVGVYGTLSHLLSRIDQNGRPYSAFESLFKGWSSYSYFNGQTTIRVTTWDQIERRIGLEASLFDVLSVRWGSDFESLKMRQGSGTTHSWGLGVDLYILVLDYTSIKYDSIRYPTFKAPKHVWQATVRIPLGSSPRNFWPGLLKRIGIF